MTVGRVCPRGGSVIILPPVAHAAAAAAAAPGVVVESPPAKSPPVDPWTWAARAGVVATLIRFVHDAIGWLSFRRQPAA